MNRRRFLRRSVRDLAMVIVCIATVFAIAAVGSPRPRQRAGTADLPGWCASVMEPGADALWLDDAWWCGGTVNGLWAVSSIDPADVCAGRAVAGVDGDGVRCNA